ncbi:MAG: NmrA family NAD(P)-binding protein, partial [Thermodesulfobacteria bacterium]|nr:NmrA family NAD(P)-binding protein [Thermodesulfobacteriota bacterium]
MEYPQTIALTGATGFIGMNILQILVRQGIHVRALFRTRPAKGLL